MESRLDLLIMCVNEAVDAISFHINTHGNHSAIFSAVNLAIKRIESALAECPADDPRKNELNIKLKTMNEYAKVFGPEGGIYSNLQYALEFRERDELDEFDIDEIKDIIEEIKDNDNIYDKLAVGIFAVLVGEEYKELAIDMLKHYLQASTECILISNREVMDMLNRL